MGPHSGRHPSSHLLLALPLLLSPHLATSAVSRTAQNPVFGDGVSVRCGVARAGVLLTKKRGLQRIPEVRVPLSGRRRRLLGEISVRAGSKDAKNRGGNGVKDEEIDISILWDESKELPAMEEDTEFEEPPEWSNDVKGKGFTMSGLMLEDEEDDPFANEKLTLDNFNDVGDGETISDDLLSFDLREFGMEDVAEDFYTSQSAPPTGQNRRAKTEPRKQIVDAAGKKGKRGGDGDTIEEESEHISGIENLGLPTSMIRSLQNAQREADMVNFSVKKGKKRADRIMEAATGAAAARVRANPQNRATHQKLRIVGGSKARKLLLSPRDQNVRPMMEKVRAAVFNLLSARFGGGGMLPEGSRWLDMFGGTGSVGIEALSRGAEATTFVELDRWVIKNILKANLHTCGFLEKAQILNMKAEDYLKRSIDYPYYAGEPFDFISVCPPYQLVSYPELFDLLSRSPLIHEKTYIVVEYPIEFKYQIPEYLDTALGGRLPKFRDRSYGRTWLAVYGPTASDSVRINPARTDDPVGKKKRVTDVDMFRKRAEEAASSTEDGKRQPSKPAADDKT